MKPRTSAARVALLGILLAQTGCYEWVAVKPDEAETLARPTVGVVDVWQPDGHVVQLARWDVDLRVALRSGEVLNFVHPVRVDVDNEDGTFVFRGGDSGEPVRVKRDGIASLEASRFEKGKAVTIAIGVAIGAAIIAVVAFGYAFAGTFSGHGGFGGY